MWVEAGGWGLVSGSALVIGVTLAYLFDPPQRAVAAVMAFGAGVLVSALCFDLMDEAFASGGIAPTAAGFLTGGVMFTAANIVVNRWGARHRKRSGASEASRQAKPGEGGLAIAVGALLDGIPESIVIGVSLLSGEGVSRVAVVAIFLSNLPEGLSSAAGMRRAGRPPLYVFGVWGTIAFMSALAAALGNVLLADAGPAVIAGVTALAAGAILAMLADTMIPEAFETAHDHTGLITVAGFLAAFVLTKVGT